MSNFLAIATVTAALRRALSSVVVADVPGATVTSIRPDSAGAGARPPVVNIYLARVTPNASWGNNDLPTRTTDGDLVERPRVALDLHYLFTFYGDEGKLEPQRLLGSVVRSLHSQPFLTRQMIQDTMADPNFNFIAESDLASEVELVKFTPLSLSLEELSKLWSVFFQTPYALTVAYEASAILIEDKSVPKAALPVRARNLYTLPFRQPTIEQIISESGADQPIVAGSTIRIIGRRFLADVTKVRIAGVEVTPKEVTETWVTLQLASPPLPAGILRGGVQGLQITQPVLMGEPAKEHRGFESNVGAFVLRPTITAVNATNLSGSGAGPRSADVNLQVSPSLGKSQRLVLLLNEPMKDTALSYAFEKVLDADSDSVSVHVSNVKAGDYLVRIQVDGAQSPLISDNNPASPTFNQYIAPKVTFP